MSNNHWLSPASYEAMPPSPYEAAVWSLATPSGPPAPAASNRNAPSFTAMPPPLVPYSADANNTTPASQRIQPRKGMGPATKSPRPVLSRPPRLTDEETLTLMKLALAHWGIRTRSCAESFEHLEKEFVRVLGRPFATTRKKVHRAMKEFRENGTVLGESPGGTRSDSALMTELRRVMQALTDAAADEVGMQGRKGTFSRRALENYEDMEDEERDYEAERQARRSVLKRYVNQESPVSGLTNPRSGDEMDAASEDDDDAGHFTMAESLLSSQAQQFRSTPRHDQSRDTSASRARSSAALQQSRKRPREEPLLADLVARLEEDQEEREEREREREKDREERKRERENLRQEREHQRVMQQETHKMNLEVFKRIAEMMAKANSRQQGVQ
jgi:hypothetical protein